MGVERAELEAFQWAVKLVLDQQWSNVIFEGDANNVIEALHQKLSRGLHNQVLVNNILASTSVLESVRFNFCYREANNVAYRLARWAVSSICSEV